MRGKKTRKAFLGAQTLRLVLDILLGLEAGRIAFGAGRPGARSVRMMSATQ